jgi:hypothetical protein
MDAKYDACLGTTPEAESLHMRFGNGDATYPIGSGSDLDLQTAIKGEVMTVRFWFRLAGNWPATGISGVTYSKFIAVGCANDDYVSDKKVLYVTLGHGGSSWRIYDYARTPGAWSYYSSADLDDGDWHSYTGVYTRLNQNQTDPNYNVEFWIDDWDMSGSSVGSRDVLCSEAGTNPFRLVQLFINYGGASSPTNEHGVEYDDFEIWDGLPT